MRTELVARGLDRPVYATAAPGDRSRLFIVEQSGSIRVVLDGALLATPFLQISVPNGYELGLTGLAFDPGYATNRSFYVSYTRPSDNASVVSRFRRSATNADRAVASSEQVVLGPVQQPYSTHNFGWIGFGPDGYLYVTTGDGGSSGDPGCRAQDGQSLLGKILRIDGNGNAPASNPFVGDPAFDDRIWAYGLRNPWRCSFDRATGDLWIGDVGQTQLEELNFQPASSAGGENYGWKIREGTQCFASGACSNPLPCGSSQFTAPIRTMPTSAVCSIIGGVVYRGCAMPALRGTYFHGDFCTGQIWSLRYDPSGVGIHSFVDRTPAVGVGNQLASFGEDADGEILLCRNFAGEVHRIVPTGTLVSAPAGAGSLGSHGLVPQHDVCGRLTAGQRGTLRVRDGLPNTPAAILFSLAPSALPLPIPGFGTLVTVPIAFQFPFSTDANGAFALEVPGGRTGGLPITLYHQVAFVDPGLAGVTLSNAVGTQFE